jgi:hypothetical protein
MRVTPRGSGAQEGGELVGIPPPRIRGHEAQQLLRRFRLVFVQPKSRAGRRTIALPGPLRDSLRAHRKAQLAERMAAGSQWQDHGWPSARRTDVRLSLAVTTVHGGRCWRTRRCHRRGCTTPGTPRRRYCCSRACPPGWRWRCSATRRSAPRHLLACRSRAGRGRRPTHGRGAVGMKWQPRWHRATGTNLRLSAKPQVNAVGPVGIEPTTRGLKVRCSAN